MKLTTKLAMPAAALAIISGLALAQEEGRKPGPERPRPPASERQDRPAPPLPPFLRALDADKDGEISASEIENAAAALLTLDANKDGKLTRDELAPPRPDFPAGPPRRDGPDGGAERPQGPPPGAPPRGPRPPRD
jgi:hypothetical protein